MIIPSEPIGQLEGTQRFVLTSPFSFYSDVLDRWVHIPAGFCSDFETMLFLRGRCRTGGIIHDYMSRKDSDPVVTKKQELWFTEKHYDIISNLNI